MHAWHLTPKHQKNCFGKIHKKIPQKGSSKRRPPRKGQI